jgi:hypothetical protein
VAKVVVVVAEVAAVAVAVERVEVAAHRAPLAHTPRRPMSVEALAADQVHPKPMATDMLVAPQCHTPPVEGRRPGVLRRMPYPSPPSLSSLEYGCTLRCGLIHMAMAITGTTMDGTARATSRVSANGIKSVGAILMIIVHSCHRSFPTVLVARL